MAIPAWTSEKWAGSIIFVSEFVAGPGLELFVVELDVVPMVRELHGDVLRLRVLAVELEDSP